MNRLTGLAAAILLAACSQQSSEETRETDIKAPPVGIATEATRSANAALAERLPLDQTSDFVDATRGLLAQLKQDTITDADGNVVWQVSRREFINGDSPDTVNPSV